VLGTVMLKRGRLWEVEPLLDQCERALEYATEPAAALLLQAARGLL